MARAAFATFALAVAGWAQECTTCKNLHFVACRSCAAFESRVVLCSVAAACRLCAGTSTTLCLHCKAPGNDAPILRVRQRRADLAQAFLREHFALLAAHQLDERLVLQCRTEHFTVLYGVERLDDCAAVTRHDQLHLYADRLEAVHARLTTVLGLDAAQPATPPRRIAILTDEQDVRRLGAAWCGIELQGLGAVCAEPGAAVLWQTRAHRSDASLHRLVVHTAAQLIVGQQLPPDQVDQLGYGWLEAGLAHWCEAEFAGGVCENFTVLERPQPPRTFWGGDWRRAVRALLDSGKLPALADLLATERSDFDFAQHAAVFAFVDHLVQAVAVPTTGTAAAKAEPGPLAAILRAARAGTVSPKAVTEVLRTDLGPVEASFHAFVQNHYSAR